MSSTRVAAFRAWSSSEKSREAAGVRGGPTAKEIAAVPDDRIEALAAAAARRLLPIRTSRGKPWPTGPDAWASAKADREALKERARRHGWRGRKHVILPASLAQEIPPLYAQESEADPVVYVKLFAPYSAGTWLITEYDPTERRAFGYADLGHGTGELGYIDIDELENHTGMRMFQGVERDFWFLPQPLSEAKRSEHLD